MSRLPEHVLENLTPEERERTIRWWWSISHQDRADIELLWDERAEDSAFVGELKDNEIIWHSLPIKLIGMFVDEENPIDRKLELSHLYEYIANHNATFFLENRTFFRICRAHPVAREALRNGLIPASFECPFAHQDCPMKKILAVQPGKSVLVEIHPNE